jgi:hypothetical protein
MVEEITKPRNNQNWMHRVLEYVSKLCCLLAKAKILANRVMGCTTHVCWTRGLFLPLQITRI